MTNSIKSPASSVLAPPAATANANTYVDPNGLAALKKDPNSPQALRAVAQQVDALFMQMMLKSMRDASAAAGESDSNEMGMYRDMFDKQIALTLSQHQGLGVGEVMTRQIGARAAASTASPADPKAGGGAPALLRHGSGPAAIGQLPPPASVPAPATGRAAAGQPPPVSAAADPATPADAGAPPTSMAHSAGDFIHQVLPTIRVAAQALGVNPLGLLAQAALETGWGKHMPRTADGKPSLNLFGIKAGEDWTGARAVASTVEYAGGVATLKHTAFRAYGSIEDSVKDFANLLRNSPRYQQALGAGTDVHGYIQHMGRSGYATDPGYADKLSDIVNGGTLHAALPAAAANAAVTGKLWKL